MLGTTRYGQRNHLLLAFAGVLLTLVGCQLVAGIKSRKLDPINAGCVLPQGGAGPQVRVANLVPTSDLVDVCIRNAGSSDWGRPILLNGGLDCADANELGAVGFAYTDVSVAFTAPSANIDVKMIPGGSTCSAAALSEGDGLSLTSGVVNTLVSYGGNGMSTQVIALAEADSPATSGQRFRLVHVAPGTGSLDVGIMAASALPTTLTSEIFSAPIPYGGTVPAGTTSAFASATVQDNGYLQLFNGAFDIGGSLDGDASKRGLFVYHYPNGTATYSMYVVGVAGDNQHPLRALVCSEDVDSSGALTTPGKTPFTLSCAPSPLSNISVDVFNAALYGPNAPDFTAREMVVPTAIAGRDADIMCIVEVDEQKDQNNIILNDTSTMTSTGTAGTGPYPYIYMPTTNLSTPFTNPADQTGKVPPAPTTTPCNGVDSSLIDAAMMCGEQNCSTSVNDPTGQLQGSTDCLVDNCAAPFLNIQTASIACYDCLVVYVASDTSWQTAQSNCTTDTRPPLGFSGAQNSMILSKYPLNNTDVLVLPATFYRRTVLYASVQLEDQSVDFYCGFLSTTLNASALPYNGNYGGTATDSQTQYNNEQTFQAQQVLNYVNAKSGTSTPAIVVGDWRSSAMPASGAMAPSGTFLPNVLNDGTMTLLLSPSNFAAAVGPSPWGTQCNFCPQQENPYNATDSYFVAQPILANWPANATTSEQLVYTTGDVSIDGGVLGPPSPYYGVNIQVIRPK